MTPTYMYKDTSGKGFWPTLIAVTVLLAGVAMIVSAPPSPAIGTTTTTLPADTRQASAQEMLFCEANWDTLGPITGDCGIVPTIAEVTEDDTWGRWDCRVDGNHTCGDVIYFAYDDGSIHGYELNAPSRPACWVEPSNVRAGYEVIFYPSLDMVTTDFGFEVTCPYWPYR